MQKPLLCFLLPTFAPLEREREREGDNFYFAWCSNDRTRDRSFCRGRSSGFAPLSSIASAIIDIDFVENSMQENRFSLRDLSITLHFSSSSFFLHNTDSLPLASSSSDAAEQTCVIDSGSHRKHTREGSAAAAFHVVDICNSMRKKKKQRLGSEWLQISREPWSIVGQLQLWNTSTSSVADL